MDQARLDTIRQARDDLDRVVAEIQDVPGYEGFLAAPTFKDIAAAATEQPLVYVAAAEFGGIALVVRGADVQHVVLDSLTADVVRTRVDAHRTAYARFVADRDPVAWNRALDETTRWLWDDVMGAILDALRGAPAAVLVAGGLLGLLPLHAAWTPDDSRPTGRRYALDESVLTYTPNARSLIAARALAAKPAHRLLGVIGPSRRPMPDITTQIRVAARAFPDATVVLDGAAATPDAVREALRDADVAHFACHGYAMLDAPLESGLHLAGDTRLTLGDLLALRLDLRLAMLTSCETSVPGTNLPDEVVALPTGLLQAGVGGVVASLWQVAERPTARLVTEFYRRWHWEKLSPPVALQRAQQWLRDTPDGEKVAEYRQARAEGAAWLPPEGAAVVIAQLAFGKPDGRTDEGLSAWAAFAYVGA